MSVPTQFTELFFYGSLVPSVPDQSGSLAGSTPLGRRSRPRRTLRVRFGVPGVAYGEREKDTGHLGSA